MEKIEQKECPLCNSNNIEYYLYSENRDYLHCNRCDLVYVPSHFFLSKDDEKAKYDNHQNSPQNQGYRDFLNRLLIPLRSYLPKDAKGLDFGSGPGPTLSIMMDEYGYDMDIYDYFYHDDKRVFENRYDFITTTEVIEHLHKPYEEIYRLWSMLKKDGILGIMTAFRVNDREFEKWYYKRDLTHVRFFTKDTFRWLSSKLDADLIIPENGVVILKKRG